VKFTTLFLGHHDRRCVDRITEALDGMLAAMRLWTVLSISSAELRLLWDLFEGRDVGANDLVPAGTEPLKPVIHHGKNSMAAFRRFQKRFARADDGSDNIWGYNHHTFRWATGPGYFVGHPAAEASSPAPFLLDYTELPRNKPPDWPDIAPSSSRLGWFVYGELADYLRRVSAHVSIGRAYRSHKPLDNWFILCREPADAG
jgi:hypothetical protein